MWSCNRNMCWALDGAGAAFLIAALVGSFWVSFILGALLLGLGFFLNRP